MKAEGSAAAPPSVKVQLRCGGGRLPTGRADADPTFASFFSSIDQHMMYLLQKDLDMAYGLVVDQSKEVRCMRLSPAGMEAFSGCSNHLQDICTPCTAVQIEKTLVLRLSATMPEELHEHAISNEEAVVDVPFFVHSAGKRSRLTFHDAGQEVRWQEVMDTSVRARRWR